MVQVKKCCCMSLRTGGLILGWLGLVGSILHVIATTITLSRYNSLKASTVMVYTDSEEIFDPTKAYAEIVYGFVDGVVSGIMIYGISDNKHLMLLPWLICNAIGIVIVFFGAIFLVGYSFVINQPVIIILALLVFGVTGFLSWLWVVVYSLYKEIRESTRQALSIDRSRAVGTAPPPPSYLQYENQSYGPSYP